LFDSSSDEEDVQVARRGSTAFLNSVTAADTRSQALEDVTEGERAPGSLTKSVDSQGRSSAGGKLSDPSNAGIITLSAKETSFQARGSRAAEKCDNSCEDDNDTHRRAVKQVIVDFEMVGEAYRQGLIHYHAGEIAEHMEQMTIGPDASGYRPSDNEGEAYRKDFIHYHVGEIAEHMEQMAIGPEASDYGPSDDENQRSDRSNSPAMCNRAEGQSSNENNASQQHSEYSSADECGRSERSIQSCNSAVAEESATLSPAAATAAAGVSATLSPAAAMTTWNGEGEAAEAVVI